MKHFIEAFKTQLGKEKVEYQVLKDTEAPGLIIDQTLKNGQSIRFLVGFSEEDQIINIYLGKYITIDNPVKREYSLQFLNELNLKYTTSKFTINKNGDIIITASILFFKNYDPSILFNLLVHLYGSAEEEYPHFMKLQWS